MSLVCFGFSHHSAPLGVLERVSLSPERLQELLRQFAPNPAVEEAAALSTCNRTEFYLVTPDDAEARRLVLDTVRRESGLNGEVDAGIYTHVNDHAAHHLFRVAAGIDSMIVGESEILGQVRRAHELAVKTGTVGGMLNAIMMRALAFGRRVRTDTNIGKGNVSIATLAVKLAMESAPNDPRLVIVGAGETALGVARGFLSAGVRHISICNRTPANAAAMVTETGGTFVPLDALAAAVAEADIVVSAVHSPTYILAAGNFQDAGRTTVIDLSVPRSIDPAAAMVTDTTVYTIGDLETLAEENRLHRLAETEMVEKLVDKETRRFARWIREAETGRLITNLRRRTEQVRSAHLERFAGSLSQDERDHFDRFGDSLTRSILHELTTNLRAINPDTDEGAREFELVCRLFEISSEPDDE